MNYFVAILYQANNYNLYLIDKTKMAGWDETNFLGRDREREIRLIKNHYETETEKWWMLNFCTRRDRDETISYFYERDET